VRRCAETPSASAHPPLGRNAETDKVCSEPPQSFSHAGSVEFPKYLPASRRGSPSVRMPALACTVKDFDALHGHTWWTKRSSPPFVGVMKPNLRRRANQNHCQATDQVAARSRAAPTG